MVESIQHNNRAREFFSKTKDALGQGSNPSVDWQGKTLRAALTECAVVFVVSFLILLVGMSRLSNVYDEGLALTGAMRVEAGQVPHRDFYANYGPAQFYILAGLFKIFGESLLVERLFDLLIKAALVTWVYALPLRIATESLLSAHPSLPCCGSSGCLTCLVPRMFQRRC